MEGSTLQATDLRDYTSYYCTCHLFSLALGMFAMVTAHSGLSGLTHAVLCISQHGCDEGKSLPMIPNPWWGGFSISAPGPAWASLPSSLLFCQHPPVQPQRASLPWISSFFSDYTRLPKLSLLPSALVVRARGCFTLFFEELVWRFDIWNTLAYFRD